MKIKGWTTWRPAIPSVPRYNATLGRINVIEEDRRVFNVAWSILMRTNAYGESPEDESTVARCILKHALFAGFLVGVLVGFCLR
jgi:hypothetical protein